MPSSVVTTIAQFTKNQQIVGDEEEKHFCNEFREVLLSLPKERGMRTPYLYKFQGFWCQPEEIQAIMAFQKHFQAKDRDVMLASIPKSGTTWLKALCFAIINRKNFPVVCDDHPLLTSNPHDLVPFLEYKLYANNQIPDLSRIPEPRVLATHVPFSSLNLLPSMNNTTAKVVYICRNPFDTFISSWHFLSKLKPEHLPELSLDEVFKMYCDGVIGFGPFWEHMLGYWNESLKRPNSVLFLKYEDLKQDTESKLKELASFLGYPFSQE